VAEQEVRILIFLGNGNVIPEIGNLNMYIILANELLSYQNM